MICINISESTYNDCLKALRKCEKLKKTYPNLIAEIRLDLCNITPSECMDLFYNAKIPLIATTSKSSRHLLKYAINGGVEYININHYSAIEEYKKSDRRIAQDKVRIIYTYNNFNNTPTIAELKKIYLKAVESKASIIRIICNAKSAEDYERVAYLYNYQNYKSIPKVPLVAYCTGEAAISSRIESINLGAPFTEVALKKKKRLNEYTPLLSEFESYIGNGLFKQNVKGKITLPTSKTAAIRSILAATIAKGESHISNIQDTGDINSLIAFAKSLGAKVHFEDNNLTIRGIANKVLNSNEDYRPAAFSNIMDLSSPQTIYVGDTHLLAQLAMPLISQLYGEANMSGEGSLMEKSLYSAKETLEEFGVNCILSENDTLPALLSGQLQGGEKEVKIKQDSPLLSGLFIALPLIKKDTTLIIDRLDEIPSYVELTLDILKKFNIEITHKKIDGKLVFNIPSKQKYIAADMHSDGDWGVAANFAVAAAIFGEITLEGLKTTSIQLDKQILDIVREAGGQVETKGRFISIKRGFLRGFSRNFSNTPYLFPIAVVLAAFCEGTSSLYGISELTENYPIRTATVIEELGRMGVKMKIRDKCLEVYGMSYTRRKLEGKILKGGNYNSGGDHRTAMALYIAALACKGRVSIENVDCINKSFPDFHTVLNSVTKQK